MAFRRGYQHRDWNGVSSTLVLLGHLFNQSMSHALLSLQILTVLLDGDQAGDSIVGGHCSGVHVRRGQTTDRGESC